MKDNDSVNSFGDSMSECPFCANPSTSTKYDLGKHKILRCPKCEIMWLYPRPSSEELQFTYNSNYFDNREFFKGQNQSIYGYYDYVAERFNKQLGYQAILDDSISKLDNFQVGESRFLDIGCGFGYLLDVAHDKGFLVTGVEFSASATRKIRSKYVFPVFTGDVLDYNVDEKSKLFDVITMMDVIEHLMNPKSTIEKVYRLLRNGGLFVLTTMDSDSLMSRLIGKRLEDFRRVREHLYFFSRKTIKALLEEKGFEVLSIRSHGHTFRLDFLANRICLVAPILGKICSRLVKLLHLSNLQIHVNPRTKIIVFAQRK